MGRHYCDDIDYDDDISYQSTFLRNIFRICYWLCSILDVKTGCYTMKHLKRNEKDN